MRTKAAPTGGRAAVATDADRLSAKVGRLAEGSAPGALLVEFDGLPDGPLVARTSLDLDASKIRQAVTSRQGVVVLFENANLRLPIVVGLISTDSGADLFQALLASPEVREPATPTEARLDGRRVVLEAHDEIVLKCGDASITLTRDGKLFVRGAYVETRATGVNRIKGGSVKIN
jgi:uncharacterized protein DUF6484